MPRLTVNCTPRDHQILEALARTPLSTDQLFRLSHTFAPPFTGKRSLRRRMQKLTDAGWVATFAYATPTPSQLNYYKLTRTGYHLVHGPKAPLPRPAWFTEIPMARQTHTHALADFIVHADVCAKRTGAELTGFYGENLLHLRHQDRELWPDCAFQLRFPSGQSFNYIVELDCGTMPVYSPKERDSLASKILFYDQYQSSCEHRFRVLFVFTRDSERVRYFLATAAELTANPQRRLFYAISLPAFLAAENAIEHAAFRDHEGKLQPLVRRSVSQPRAQVPEKLIDPALVAW